MVLDAYLVERNTKLPRRGRGMNGRTTPERTFRDGIPKATRKENETDLNTTARSVTRGR